MNVEYIDHMGTDLSIVNSARVSFDKQSDWEPGPVVHGRDTRKGVLADKDVRLISYLARNNHWTPFSHTSITLRETVPLLVARQR